MAAPSVLLIVVLAYGLGMGWLSVERHMTLRTNAEDLGFTDQVIWNFLRGQAFRFSLYEGAEWDADINIAAVRRPDSLLAFHVEPMLLLFVPVYAAGGGATTLLWLQAFGVAAGAVPAYRLGRRRLGSNAGGFAAATCFLMAPIGQWAVLSDFHTVTLAAPLLMLAIDALDEGSPRLFLAAGLLAVTAKEEIGVVFAGLALVALLSKGMRSAGLAGLVLGIGWSLVCVALIIPHYSGGVISPFTARYADLGTSPVAALWTLVARPSLYLELLSRPEVTAYLMVLLLSGGWIAMFAPELIMPAGIVVALNVLSNSPWMASGHAHYSASVLPFLVAAAVIGMARVGRVVPRPRWLRAYALPATFVLGVTVAYLRDGAGPLAEGFVPPLREPRHDIARQFAARVPARASVSASTGLVPHVSQRSDVYLFPTVRNADYILVDVAGGAYPTSPGDTYMRIRNLLMRGEYWVQAADSGIMLLARGSGMPDLPDAFLDFARLSDTAVARESRDERHGNSDRHAIPSSPVFLDGSLRLVSAKLAPSGDLGPQGPLATLETVWVAQSPIPGRARPSFDLYFRDGSQQHWYDLETVWWFPPEQWLLGEFVRIDVRGVSLREVTGWSARVVLEGMHDAAPTLASD